MSSSSSSQDKLRYIASVDSDIARQVLHLLCTKDSDIRETAFKMIAKIEDEEKICVQCEEPFDDEDNGDGACAWHPGTLEVDYDDDVWADHDENCHGVIEPKGWLLEECPEGFVWDCCNKRSNEPGCERDAHRSSLENENQATAASA